MKWCNGQWSRLLTVTLAASVFGGAGCGAVDETDDSAIDSLDLNSEKDDGFARPVGTYQLKTLGFWYPFEKLVLLSDRRFHRERTRTCNRGAPCPPAAVEGRYQFTSIGGKKYIRFNSATGVLIDKYAYRTSASAVLELRRANSSQWMRFERAASAYCGDERDCSLQGAEVSSRCEGAWACNANLCSFQCGLTSAPVCSNEAPTNAALCVVQCRNGYKVLSGEVTCACCRDEQPEPNPCFKTGCGGEVCADRFTVTACIARSSDECYRGATCARQAGGACGWTASAELRSCLATH